MIVAKTFLGNSIPWELHEAAFLDGVNDVWIFRKVILPLSAPIIVVLMLYYGVGHWNAYVRYSATDRGKAYKSLYIHI